MSIYALEADLLLEVSQETGSDRGDPPIIPHPPPKPVQPIIRGRQK